MAEETDFSKAIEQVKAMLSSEDGENQIQNILGMLAGGQSAEAETEEKPNTNSPSADGPGIGDMLSGMGNIETIMKLKNVLGSAGSLKGDSNTAFLQALRPFLSESRQNKIDSAAKILNMTKMLKLLKDSGLGGV
ncbi:MAG: hypothetical protein IJE62_00705 [Clostridia bacterium]|nr:hypothetical protein [Clostridia bacterium]